MRKLVVAATSALVLLVQASGALAMSESGEGECIRRCYVAQAGGVNLDLCLVACINKYPKGIVQSQPEAIKPELGDALGADSTAHGYGVPPVTTLQHPPEHTKGGAFVPSL